MAVSETHVAATPDEVFAVLSDRTRYGDWVVGTQKTVPAHGDWPEPGSALRYSTVGPLPLRDETVVLAADEPSRLVLRTKAGPFPDGEVVLEILPEDGGSRVRLQEGVANPVLNLLLGPVGHFLLARRNDIALGKLRRIAEGRA
jgi:uncharacterized protein YndB with AHSA1/START domain